MLGLSFSEIFLITALAIVLIKPQDLPAIIKTAVHYIKKLRGFSSEIKKTFADISKDIGLAEEEKKITGQIRDLEGTLRDTYSLDDIDPLIIEQKTPDAAK